MLEPSLRVELRQAAPIPLDLAFECAAGELLALVGPSGAGKTSVLRAIAGLLPVEQGRIDCGPDVWFDAATRVNLPPQARRIGMVFQNYALFPHLTALANVMEGTAGAKAQRKEAAQEWLRRVHLHGLERRLPRELSGGQQQRVALARALAGTPQALMLDEPFAALDRASRERLHEELAELHQQLHIPTLLVTHDLEEAAVLADRICILSRGRGMQIGIPAEVMQRPVNTEVARMVGLVNVFEGRVLAHDEAMTTVHWQGHRLRVRGQPAHNVGSRVYWAVPAAGVLLAADTARGHALDNPVEALVDRCLALGDHVQLRCRLLNSDAQLSTRVPRHVGAKYELRPGARVQLRLRGADIQLMTD